MVNFAVIGAGFGALTAAQALRKRDPNASITLIGIIRKCGKSIGEREGGAREGAERSQREGGNSVSIVKKINWEGRGCVWVGEGL